MYWQYNHLLHFASKKKKDKNVTLNDVGTQNFLWL